MSTTPVKNPVVGRHAQALGIDEATRRRTSELLNVLLADYHIYYQNLRNLHWNIRGRQFFTLHVKFEELYNEASAHIDEIAERVLTLGFTPAHTLKDYLAMTRMEELDTVNTGSSAVEALLDNLEVLIRNLRATLEEVDAGTEDQLIGYVQAHEKTVWMFAAWHDQE